MSRHFHDYFGDDDMTMFDWIPDSFEWFLESKTKRMFVKVYITHIAPLNIFFGVKQTLRHNLHTELKHM